MENCQKETWVLSIKGESGIHLLRYFKPKKNETTEEFIDSFNLYLKSFFMGSKTEFTDFRKILTIEDSMERVYSGKFDGNEIVIGVAEKR